MRTIRVSSSLLGAYVFKHHHLLFLERRHLRVCFLELLFYELLVQRVRHTLFLLAWGVFLQGASPEFPNQVHKNLEIQALSYLLVIDGL